MWGTRGNTEYFCRVKEALINRFGSDRVQSIPVGENECPLLLLEIQARTSVRVLMTNGLSNYKMPVAEKEIGFEHNELYFCLPTYWELDDLDNPRMNWVFEWIQRLAAYVQEKNTWFAHGHTMPCGKEKQPLSETMKQNNFLLIRPLFLEDQLKAIKLDDKTVHFLAIVPIFESELSYKMGKGTFKFIEKFARQGNSEKLDDFRAPTNLSRLSMFRRG